MAKAADLLVPEGDNFRIVQRNHYHAAANGLLGEYKYGQKSLFPSSFPNYVTEHFSDTDINISNGMGLPSGLGTPWYYDLFNNIPN